MVRLRLDMVLSLNVNRKFTIHYGEIKTQGKGYQAIATYLFTIHYGEIKTDQTGLQLGVELLFTIHYGEIKTKQARS